MDSSQQISEKDLERGNSGSKISHWRLVWEQGLVTDEVRNASYKGSGTEDDPYLVEWLEHDPRNPLLWPSWKKWVMALTMAFATLAVSFCSSAYAGGETEMVVEFGASEELVTAGLSVFVLGFALGPMFWGPLSELYGRQYLYIFTFGAFAAFNAGFAGAQNIWTVIICRFFAGSFGSSPLTNAGGVIADMFPAKERGLAMSVFSVAPFMGPVLGPIIGGFLGMTEGWRWIGGLMAIFSGFIWVVGSIISPETYSPVLLRRRAQNLSKITGKVYESRADHDRGKVTFVKVMSTSLKRPWILLFKEPIVLLLSVYMAIIYGTLYMLFGAFPQVYQLGRGWSQGISGLAFVGVAVGMLIAMVYNFYDNERYIQVVEAEGGFAPPEARLPPVIIGSFALPIGLFWFAWTNSPNIHWLVSIAAGVPFGFGMVLVFMSIMNYLIDAYTIFAASVLAANSILRSLFGAAFPLFTTQMFRRLGIHWASTIPAFLALACMPFPFLFYKYGAAIRMRCKYAAEADAFMEKIRGDTNDGRGDETNDETKFESNDDSNPELDAEDAGRHSSVALEKEEEAEQEAMDFSYGARTDELVLAPTRTDCTRADSRSERRSREVYDESPYDIDRVNTKESFKDKNSSLSLSTTKSRDSSKSPAKER
ncbi:MFS general substrate transporter [Pseudovirgaria hyperparasitica]|uniref:MFS general substrate transporter n=1 Tax=Pseudovirgaria hyperparasitica TaxID=470096 RepID=A0A6A6WFK0_9PEZI|nr:MFS general substrate transporter [Pseudovirgaria hyperparasitica]KAF2761513.1 MFS general substrate transporter [Pseudovirgaria hyperparasitica]